MALRSTGKRSIRYEYDDGGGDNHLSKSGQISDFLNVEMVERDSFVGEYSNSRRYFGGMIGNKELAAMTLLGVALYLINGEHAQLVCTALTSVPPAIFSYRVLSSQETTREGFHSILFYWTIYGLLALIDQFIGSAQGYNLCKGGLLCIVFFHALRSNLSAIPWQFVDPATADLLTTILNRYDSEPSLRQYSFPARTLTMTQFSEEDSLEYIFPIESTVDPMEEVSTAVSFMPSLEMQSTQHLSPETMRLEDGEEELTEDISSVHLRNTPQKQFQSMSAITVTHGGVPDIVTVPSDHVTFSYNKREAVIQVTNTSPLHIMFALKTNADTYLIAAPTAGVIFSGQIISMRVGVTDQYFEDFSDAGKSIDKLAIDYASIPASQSSSFSKFSAQFFQAQNRRRHAIRVFYN